MIKKQLLLWLIIFYGLSAFAQGHLGFSSGISIDVNNKGKFKQIPVSVQWLPGKSKNGSFILKADVAIPLGYNSYDSAYTLANGMSPAIAVQKNIKNFWFSLIPGYRFHIHLKSEGYFFIDILPFGFIWQKFIVDYRNYDKASYDVLNPDVGIKRLIGCSAGGLGYCTNRFTVQIHATGMDSFIGNDYTVSYKLNSPLEITAGYLLSFHKKQK